LHRHLCTQGREREKGTGEERSETEELDGGREGLAVPVRARAKRTAPARSVRRAFRRRQLVRE
jgi:hypothetical protein